MCGVRQLNNLLVTTYEQDSKDVPGGNPRYLNKVKNGWYRVKHSFRGVFFHLTKRKDDKNDKH